MSDNPHDLVEHQCPSCAVWHAIPIILEKTMMRNRETSHVTCPNGHKWFFSKEDKEDTAKASQKNDARVIALQREVADLKAKLEERELTIERLGGTNVVTLNTETKHG